MIHHRKIIKSNHKGWRRMHLKDEWYHREKACSGKVSKNFRTRSQADTDCWHGLFDIQASRAAEVSRVSRKRAVSGGSMGIGRGERLWRPGHPVWLPGESERPPPLPAHDFARSPRDAS